MQTKLSLLLLLLGCHCLSAQDPVQKVPVSGTTVVMPSSLEQIPPPVNTPALKPVPSACKETVCVSEPKKNTKVVYTTRCKEYCVPKCSILSWLTNDCGCGDECQKHTKNVLVKKIKPDCDTKHCVLKEVSSCVTPGK